MSREIVPLRLSSVEYSLDTGQTFLNCINPAYDRDGSDLNRYRLCLCDEQLPLIAEAVAVFAEAARKKEESEGDE